MAKKKTKSAPRAQMAPWQPRVQMAMARAAPVARRVGGAAAKAAMGEKHTIVALVASAALGYADREDMLERFSFIDGVDPKVQLALAVWLVGKMTKNNTIQHAATGIASVALYDAVKSRA